MHMYDTFTRIDDSFLIAQIFERFFKLCPALAHGKQKLKLIMKSFKQPRLLIFSLYFLWPVKIFCGSGFSSKIPGLLRISFLQKNSRDFPLDEDPFFYGKET